MKLAIIDEVSFRGRNLQNQINEILTEVQVDAILGAKANGPLAYENATQSNQAYDYILAHHAQLRLAQILCPAAKIIQYTAFYDENARRHGGVWIEHHIGDDGQINATELRRAMGVEQSPESEPRTETETEILPPMQLSGIWHALASVHMTLPKLAPYLHALEHQHGQYDTAKNYRLLFEQDPQLAFEFAVGHKQASRNRGTKDEQSLRYECTEEYEKRTFRLLIVDDNRDNYTLLKTKFTKYLRDNNEPFDLDLIHIDSVENLQDKYPILEDIQAVIFDDRFPTDINLYATINALAAIRPSVPFYILGSDLAHQGNSDGSTDLPIFLPNVRAYEYKDEKRMVALFDGMMADFNARLETPYFSALNKYATERKSAFHALPITDGGSVNDSPWLREFGDFYSRKFFAAETSNTKAPLSSVFSPQGELKRALDKASAAFQSDKTLFITSGTTVSNLLVYKIHIRKGDVVLLDWNCHKSHHNAMVECGAQVKYLKSEYNSKFAMAGLVSTSYILEQLHKLKSQDVPVKMISLTHPSFDGMLYDVEKLMREANKIYPGIIFFFDEAWFAYGAFYPQQDIRHRSAMLAAKRIRQEALKATDFKQFPTDDVRVYVTHSIHKTLSSIRQGSMLHIHDPYLNFANASDRLHLKYMIDNAYETYITTSPNNSILGSLDIARMQAEVEGYDRIRHAQHCVKLFKLGLKAMCAHSPEARAMGFRVIEADELIPNEPQDNVLLDPLKVTLYFDLVPGAQAVKSLNEYNIQINKYSANTVLLLFSIGVTRGNVQHLLSSLHDWAKNVHKNQDFSEDVRTNNNVPQIPNFHNQFVGNELLQIACLKHIHDQLHSSRLPGTHDGKTAQYTKSEVVSITNLLIDETWRQQIEHGNVIAAQAMTPYPPGSPVIVAGQVLSKDILIGLVNLKKSGGEIHGVVKSGAGEDCVIVARCSNR
ncbi:MAG: hypothetical protein KJ930_12135 [Gammaproteobacteria bacterium]|nr:hypothetical protein [Gammaproteobacteria bacterium]MBU2180168.1 hypothetical protein [Gammaproteobacteria bacterium]MBU2223959.1 hypothetical protein [Gammaproteobacteria bacterium]MBU2279615.1 hypothetical protein [Gammaproteobacteria bacterium]MBU2427754.1 hypothetical protein [Gammaproteobacteria bacterium]